MADIVLDTQVAPIQPGANTAALYVNSTTKLFSVENDTGRIMTMATMDSQYNVLDYGFKNDGVTDNLAAWNTLFAQLPVRATVFFPAGLYNFSGELTLNADLQLLIKGAGRSRSLLFSTSITANLFNITVAAFYYQFEDIGFRTTVTKTAGNFIGATNNNAYLEVRRCEFQGYFSGISLTGATAGNIGIIEDCEFNVPAANATALTINGSTINLNIINVIINSGTVAGTTGCLINQCGAIQISGCDFIGGVNALLVNATATVSSLFVIGTFFDQSTLGSTVKFMGTASITRVKFCQCGITCGTAGGAGVTACEIAGTGTGTSIPDGIDFIDCDFYNNGGSGTTNGLLVTGCKGFSAIDCRFAGFTNAIQVTPYNTNGFTHFDILNNTIGATENFSANATGILLNAGAVQYGSFQIAGNNFAGNTAAQITDNSTIGTTGQKLVTGNYGSIAQAPTTNYTATSIPLTTVTNVDSRGGMLIPAATRPVRVRITIRATNAATLQTLTATVRYGTNNTNADAAVLTQAFATGTAAVGSGLFQFDVAIPTTTTLDAMVMFFNGNNAATGIAGNISLFAGLSAAATISTAANNWLGVYFSSATAAAITIRSVKYEVLDQ